MGFGARQEAHHALEQELAKERARALARAGEKVENAFEALRQIEAILQGRIPHEGLEDPKELYEKRYQAAHQARWELQVHREAIGLRDPYFLDEIYPLPKRLRF